MKHIMKRFTVIITLAITAIAICGCGTSFKLANDPYAGHGHGESFSKNIAREKAYNEAVAEIARKYNVEVVESTGRCYESDDRTKGRTEETLAYKSVVSERSEARLGDVVIRKEKTVKMGKRWISDMIVAIDADNIE